MANFGTNEEFANNGVNLKIWEINKEKVGKCWSKLGIWEDSGANIGVGG